MSTAGARIATGVALLGLSALPCAARVQTRSPWLPPPPLSSFAAPAIDPVSVAPPAVRALPPLLTRPLSLPTGAIVLQWGAGFAFSALGATGFRSNNLGLGLSFDLSAGLGRHLQLDFGTGLRLGTLLAADRYGRVFRDDVFQTGNRFVGNPWLKLRYAFLDDGERPLRVGVEVLLQAPIAENSAWSVGVGVPLQLALPAARLRLESGAFLQFMLSDGSAIRHVLNVPLRVLLGVSDDFAVGVVTGVQVGNAFRADATDANVQFGLVLRARVSAAVELSGQWLVPAASPAGLDAYGVGFAVTHRAR